MDLTLTTRRLVTASAAFDAQGGELQGFELVQDGTVVETLGADALQGGRVTFAEREVAAGAKIKGRAQVLNVIETEEKTVE